MKIKLPDMNFVKSLMAGFAGAAALNILHETMRKLDNEAPRLDLLGEQVVKKSAEALNIDAPTGNKLYGVTMAGDILTNATYFAAIGMGGKKYMLLRAIGAGVSAGVVALKAPESLELNENYVGNSDKRKLLTVAYYVFGALITAGVVKFMSKKKAIE